MRTYFLRIAFSIILLIPQCVLAKNQISDSIVNWKNEIAKAYKLSTSPRTYKIKTSNVLRDNLPSNKEKLIVVSSEYPQVESNAPLFDALYALTVEELRQNSVEKINDGAFKPSSCHCFETGRKWNYVWTRDISYSAHLSLATFNQQRTLNSLLFKVSNRRGQGKDSLEVIQDTGTGGSWPISTDRVVWSIAARELINQLSGEQRNSFIKIAYTALKNTVSNDRLAIYDETDGLYTGEQSFLDWREQTYPAWVKRNVVHIGMSKSLSTNITHYMAIKTLSELSFELKKIKEANYYSNLAKNLKTSINKYFWDEHKGLYSTFLVTYLDQTKVDKYDLLGNSMAIIFDIAQTNKQKEALQNYPMVLAGAPVIAPQDPKAPIYHNRAIWPFVTQYGLLAAQKNKQAKIYNHLFESMIRGTSLNLSNMENYEFLSMKNWLDDGKLAGPIVNSQRQLWSVAAMLSTYIDGIFGKEVKKDKIRFLPFITEKIRNTILSSSKKLSLSGFKFQDKLINVEINLPKNKSHWNEFTFYNISSVTLNGTHLINDEFIKYSDLNEINKIEISLGSTENSHEKSQIYNLNEPFKLSHTEYEKLFSPETPFLYEIKEHKGKPVLNFQSTSLNPVLFNIYRNGKIIAKNLNQSHYIDSMGDTIQTPCYVVESIYNSSGNRSLHSEPHCFWRKNAITKIPLNNLLKTPNQKLEIRNLTVTSDGTYAVQLSYNNIGEVNTGITCSVKKLKVIHNQTGEVISEKIFMMPHHNGQRYWNDSNFLEVNLEANKFYTFKISDFYNMSYFEHFNNYLYRGGMSGADNSVNLTELKVLRIK